MSDHYCVCGLLAYTCGECNVTEPVYSAELAIGKTYDDLAAELAEVKKELEAKLRVIVSLEGAMEMQRIFYEQCRKEHHRVVAEQIRYIDYERARAEKAEAVLAMCDIGLAEASALLKEAGIPCLGLAHARAAIRGAKE